MPTINFPPEPAGATTWQGQGGDLDPFARPEPQRHPEPTTKPQGAQQ